MTEAQARAHLETLMVTTQKLCSNIIEEGITQDEVRLTNHWLADDQNMVAGLEKTLSNKQIKPGDFYNWMYIASTTDLIQNWCHFHHIEFPAPDVRWMIGFEPEEEKA